MSDIRLVERLPSSCSLKKVQTATECLKRKSTPYSQCKTQSQSRGCKVNEHARHMHQRPQRPVVAMRGLRAPASRPPGALWPGVLQLGRRGAESSKSFLRPAFGLSNDPPLDPLLGRSAGRSRKEGKICRIRDNRTGKERPEREW